MEKTPTPIADKVKQWAALDKQLNASPTKAYSEALAEAANARVGSEKHTKALATAAAERQKLVAAKLYGSSPLVGGEGALLEWPGEAPEVGQPLTLVTADGTSSPAPAGVHQTESGYQIEVDEEGVITAVTEVKAEAADPEKDKAMSTPTPKRVSGTVPEVRPRSFGILPTRHSDERRWVEGADLLARAKSHNPDVRKKYDLRIDHRRNYTTNADLTGMAQRALNYLSELAYETRTNSSILSLMNRVEVRGMENVANVTGRFEVDVPRIQMSNVRFRKDDNDCRFEPAPIVAPSRRTIVVGRGILDLELCAANFRGLFGGVIYVNDEAIPAESVLLEIIASELAREDERQVFRGNIANAVDYFDGLETLLAADAERAAAVAANPNLIDVPITAPNATNGLDGVNTIVSALTAEVHNVHRRLRHFLLFSPTFNKFYKDDSFLTHGVALQGYGDYFTPVVLSDSPVDAVSVEALNEAPANRAYLVPENSLHYVSLEQDVWARQDPRSGSLLLTMKRGFGMNYAFGRQIIRATWA